MTQFELFATQMEAIKKAAGLSDHLTNVIMESVMAIYESEDDLDEDETEGTEGDVESGIVEGEEPSEGEEPGEVTEEAIRELIDGLGEFEDEEDLADKINEIRELIGELPEPADEDEKDARINLLTDFMDTLIASNEEAEENEENEDEKAIVESNRYEQHLIDKGDDENAYLGKDDYDSKNKKRAFRSENQYAGGKGSNLDMLNKAYDRAVDARYYGNSEKPQPNADGELDRDEEAARYRRAEAARAAGDKKNTFSGIQELRKRVSDTNKARNEYYNQYRTNTHKR